MGPMGPRAPRPSRRNGPDSSEWARLVGMGPTDRPTDRPTGRPTDRPTDRPFRGERSEPRRIAGRDFVRLILSFALGFVRVSFPRAIAVGFSFSWLTAASEMSAARVEVRPPGCARATSRSSIATVSPPESYRHRAAE